MSMSHLHFHEVLAIDVGNRLKNVGCNMFPFVSYPLGFFVILSHDLGALSESGF